jgi:ribonuclease J
MTHDFESDIEGIQFRTFRTGAKIQIGSISVHPCHVDHSVPAAYGFVLQCSEGAIAYTGDFRMHGGKPEMTDDFVELASEWRPGLLLAEGTNIAEAHISSEQEVRLKIQLLVEKTRGIVLANFAYSDIDRLKTFYEVCRSTGRTLAISLRQAYLLESLSADASLELPDLNHDESIVAYRREKKRYADWEQVTIERCRTIDAADVKKDQRRYVMVCSLPDLTELLAIKPSPGSNFILSMSEPVNEEQEIEFEKMMNWLDHFGLPMYHAHSSGHIMPNDLRISIERIKPAGVAAIHTEHGGLFSKYLGGSAKILVPSKGEKLKVF